MPQPKLSIATPAYGSRYAAAYVRSLFGLLTLGQAAGIRFAFSDIDHADVVSARNYLISNFWFNKPDCTHLLFIDDDMGFAPTLVQEMLALGEPVVGVVAPRRTIDLRKLHSLGGMDFTKAYAQACSFIVEPGGERHPVNPRFAKVPRCGAGILLVSREAVATLVEKCPEIVDAVRFRRSGIPGNFTQFLTPFDKIRTSEVELSEDFSFCHRWTRQCGGGIYASIAADIQHVGDITVQTKFSDRFA